MPSGFDRGPVAGIDQRRRRTPGRSAADFTVVLVVAERAGAADGDQSGLVAAGLDGAAVVGEHRDRSPSMNARCSLAAPCVDTEVPMPTASLEPNESKSMACRECSSRPAFTSWLHITPEEMMSCRRRQVSAAGAVVERGEHRAGEGVAHDDEPT